MFKIRITDPKVVLIALVILQALLACWVLAVEIVGWSRWFPMDIFPNDHKASWAKVILYCTGAILSVLVVRRFTTKKQLNICLPSLKSVFSLGAVFTLFSIFISHYLSAWGWCCESRLVFYFGFPFSYLLGVGGYDYPSLLPFENSSLFQVLSNPQLAEFWRVHPYKLFLDFLFWSNGVLVFTSVMRWLSFRKSNSIETVQGQVQSESR